jgi:hypothetical protein
LTKNERLPVVHETNNSVDEFEAMAIESARLYAARKEIFQKALDSLIAGQANAKKVLLYSGISSNLSKKLHVYLMGESNKGKSYIQNQIGYNLFPARYEEADFSPRALYYEVVEKKNPHLYDKKIIQVDEYKDQREDFKKLLKKVTSNKRKELRLKTLTEKRKFLDIEIEGMPVIWTNSMEVPDDEGNQQMNRYFKLNVDEGLELNELVEAFQQREEELGSVADPKIIEQARQIVDYIILEGDFEVLNPFASFIKQNEFKTFNQRPMLNSLISAIAYFNWWDRPRFDAKCKKYLLASLSDVIEALEIWSANEGCQQSSLPARHQAFLKIFGPDKFLSTDEMATEYFIKNGVGISAETAYQYAHQLEKQNVLTSKNRAFGHCREWSLVPMSSMSNNPILELHHFTKDQLMARIDGIFSFHLINTTSMNQTPLDLKATAEAVLDAPLPGLEMGSLQDIRELDDDSFLDLLKDCDK